MAEIPLDGPPHPAICRALEAYLDAGSMAERAKSDETVLAGVRLQYAAFYRAKGGKALAEFCRGAKG